MTMTGEKKSTHKKLSPWMRMGGIFLMVVGIVSLGFYLAHPGKVRAKALKMMGLYGLGDGLYPMKNSQSGEIRTVHFNGQLSSYLECETSLPPAQVARHYSSILQKKSPLGKIDQFSPPPSQRSEAPDAGVFKVMTHRYQMLGTVTSEGHQLGVIIFPWESGSRYYLCRTESRSTETQKALVPSPQRSKSIFSLEERDKEQGMYFFKSFYSPQKALDLYQNQMKRKGWKVWGEFTQAYRKSQKGNSMAFRKEGKMALVSLRENRKHKVFVTIVVRPFQQKR